MCDQMPYIVIDHRKLGEDTELAIHVGNFMHKSAVICGLACLCSGAYVRGGVCSVLFGVGGEGEG